MTPLRSTRGIRLLSNTAERIGPNHGRCCGRSRASARRQPASGGLTFSGSIAAPAPAPRGPAALDPDHGSSCRTPQDGHVLRQQQQAERSHPDPQKRQDAEKAAHEKEGPDRKPHPPRERSPKPPEWTGAPGRKPVLQTPQLAVEPRRVTVDRCGWHLCFSTSALRRSRAQAVTPAVIGSHAGLCPLRASGVARPSPCHNLGGSGPGSWPT